MQRPYDTLTIKITRCADVTTRAQAEIERLQEAIDKSDAFNDAPFSVLAGDDPHEPILYVRPEAGHYNFVYGISRNSEDNNPPRRPRPASPAKARISPSTMSASPPRRRSGSVSARPMSRSAAGTT
jgi:hypothetical protein